MSNPKESAWFRGCSVEPGEGDANPEGTYTRNESGRTETCAETRFSQGNVHGGKGKDLTNEGSVKEYEVERVGMDGYQQNARTSRTRGYW